MSLVIDTNVAITANGRDTHAGVNCQLRCVELLEALATGRRNETVVLDDTELMLTEYSAYLNYRGQPGVGDLFYKYLHDHMFGGENVRLVSITPCKDEARGFEELPTNLLDKSDRKFLAAAVVSGSDIVNALDSDWQQQPALLSALGVNVVQLCPEHACSKL